jgi:sugar phosphate isomerase/epimerase
LNWRELAASVKEAGFDGVDLTVRPGGHVLPERVATDLPKAVADIRAAGVEVPMITTGLLSADDPAAEPTFRTAGKLSIPYLKPGYYRYTPYLRRGYYNDKPVDVVKEVDDAGVKLSSLISVAARYGIQVGYHNHPRYIGEAVWDIFRVIEPLDPKWCGFYYDLCQATMDGGVSGWKVSTNLVIPRLKMVAVKDFSWKKATPHRWITPTVPLEQGASHWKEFLSSLAQSDFHGPISLQQEYPIPGVADDTGVAFSKATCPAVMAEARKELDYLKSMVREAYA